MSDSNNTSTISQPRWRFVIITLLIFPVIGGVAVKAFEYCLEGRLSVCEPRPNPIPEVPTRTPLGMQLAFDSRRTGDYDIYTMEDDGSDLIQLTDNPASDSDPSWSPDGSKIAFTSNRDGDDEIYVMNADGSGLRQLTINTASDCCADWSPDGSKIAFNSNWPNGHHDIYVVSSDGTGLTNLTNFSGDDRNPNWSPDGTKIAFDARRDGQADIYIMNADGTNPMRLTYLFSAQRSPAWSPNGAIIAYDSNQLPDQPDAEGDHDIFLMNSDGSNQVRLVDNPGEDRYPSWSPDGQFITFTSFTDEYSVLNITTWAGQQLTRLIESPADGGGADWKPVP